MTVIVDLPDREISLMVRLCLQNEGRLSKNKRDRFPLLRDEEIAQMQTAIQAVLQVPAR